MHTTFEIYERKFSFLFVFGKSKLFKIGKITLNFLNFLEGKKMWPTFMT